MSGAQQLRDWLARRGYNQVEGATALEMHEAFMSMLINGKRKPSLSTAVKIERLTGIPVAAWMSSLRHNSSEAVSESSANALHNKA